MWAINQPGPYGPIFFFSNRKTLLQDTHSEYQEEETKPPSRSKPASSPDHDTISMLKTTVVVFGNPVMDFGELSYSTKAQHASDPRLGIPTPFIPQDNVNKLPGAAATLMLDNKSTQLEMPRPLPIAVSVPSVL